MSFDTAFATVGSLAKEFDENKSYFLSAKYQESELRTDFLNKFFVALGWDVEHREQTNPREQEVKIERNADQLGMRKADYAFYLKPDYQRPQFLVEAKKPSVILQSPEFYFQTARYGYNTSTSVAVLTDFKEFHIVDCRRRPQNVAGIVDYAQLARYTYQDYLDRDKFGEIYWKFSREAVETGQLKEYRKSLAKPKGTGKQVRVTQETLAPVDESFLAELDEHRKTLASEFKKANPALGSEELTEAAQKVLDRLVFIRFLEDKMIEPDFIIDRFATSGSWKKFKSESQKLDKQYNGVVFKSHLIDSAEFNPPNDDKFSAICAELCHRNSPFLFSYIPVEILGSIYERFLGKVVVAKGRGIAIEEKPEVRKAGGVYYTPKYIVDYIVENTVGKILRGESGSGSGTRGSGSGGKSGKEINTIKNEKLSRARRMETSGGPGGRNIQSDGKISEEGDVRVSRSNTAGSNIDPFQHSGGMGTNTSQGISASSIDGIRLVNGGRNSVDNSSPAHVPDAGSSKADLGVMYPSRNDVKQTESFAAVTPSPEPRVPSPDLTPLTPTQVSKLRFADIACGSGSFLVAIFDRVVAYLEEWYNAHPDEARKAKCRELSPSSGERRGLGGGVDCKFLRLSPLFLRFNRTISNTMFH